MVSKNPQEQYWNKNIENWGMYYYNLSDCGEKIIASPIISYLYKRFISPIEANLMKKRYHVTLDFIKKNVNENMVVVDIGCGTGIFTVEILKKNAFVYAVDFSEVALKLTKELVQSIIPELSRNVEYVKIDVTETPIPRSNLAIAMGVTPYIDSLDSFFSNILPKTEGFYYLCLDSNHWINNIRSRMQFLNVRKMNYFSKSCVDSILKAYGWKLLSRKNFASGFIDFSRK